MQPPPHAQRATIAAKWPSAAVASFVWALAQNLSMTELFSGLTAPDWWRSPAGLWLPGSVQGQPGGGPRERGGPRRQHLLVAHREEVLPGIAAFATPEVVGQPELGLPEIQHLIRKLPREDWLNVISLLQARLWAIQANAEKHFDLAAEIFEGTPAWRGIERFLKNGAGARVAFSEQGLTLLQWMVVVNGVDEPSRELTTEELGTLRMGLLAIAGHIDVQAERTASGEPENWLYYLTQNFAFNSKPIVGNAIGRTWQIYGRLARELGPDTVPNHAPIDEWFAEDYKLTLEQQLALGFGLHAHLKIAEAEETGGRHKTVVGQEMLDDLYGRLELSEEQRRQAGDLISAPFSWFQDQVGGKTVGRASWDQVPMMQRPLLRLDDQRYLLLSPRGLESWFSDGVYYRGLDCARRRGKRAVSDYTAYIGHLTETYALQMARSVHREPRLPHAGKVYGDKNFGDGAHSSDIAIAYPNELALVEISSRRLTLESRCDGDPDALRFDLQEMAGRRVGQLDRSINAIKPRGRAEQPTLRYPAVEPGHLARIWPLIVTAIPLTWSPQLEKFLADENPGALERDDVEALDILALEDLEALLAAVEQTGRRLVDLLKAKQAAAGEHADVRRWLSSDRRAPNFARPRYLSAAFEEACDAIQEALGFGPGESEPLRESA
jgi:hypothetical protein